MKNWIIIDWGKVPKTGHNTTDFTCVSCGEASRLPVVGLAIAQIDRGLVFDQSPHAVPDRIRCPRCRHTQGIT